MFSYHRRERKIDLVLRSLQQLERRIYTMTQALEGLRAQVAKNGDVVQSAVTLIRGLNEKIKAAVAEDDSEALNQLTQDLDSQAQNLAAAIPQNTSAAEGQ